MPDQKLLDYINQQLKSGVSREEVKIALAGAGWQQSFIDDAFSFVGGQKFSVPVPEVKATIPVAQAPAEIKKPEENVITPEPVGNPRQREAILPFKVQPVPQAIADPGFIPNFGNDKPIEPTGPKPAERDEIYNENVKSQPGGIDEKADAIFGGSVPKVSELDQSFGKTFGVGQGSSAMDAAALPQKTILDPFIPDDGAAAPDSGKKADLGLEDKVVFGSEKKDKDDFDEMLDKSEEKLPKKKRSGILFLIIGIIGVLLLGGAAFAYFYYLEPTPASVFQKMAEKSSGLKTVKISGKVLVGSPLAAEPAGEGGPADIAIDFSGVLDARNVENLAGSITFDETDNSMSGSSAAKLEAVSSDNTLYLNATGLSGPGTAELVSYEGQWIKIDGSSISQEFGSVFPVYDKIREGAGIGDINIDQLARMLMAASKPAVIKPKDKLADETVFETDCRHYSFEVDKEALKIEVAAAMSGPNAAEVEKYDRIIDNESIAGEIWIGKKDFMVYKTSYSIGYEDAETPPAKVDLKIEASGYNSEVSVVVPVQYRLGSEIFGEVRAKKEQLVIVDQASRDDSLRKNDLKMLFSAQKSWYLANKRFYTCSTVSGDCGGKALNFPASIGDFMKVAPTDPRNAGTICGQDFVYCGLDNSKNPKSFCYYAKMSDASFFTASPYGNFIRSSAPKSFKECQQGTLVE